MQASGKKKNKSRLDCVHIGNFNNNQEKMARQGKFKQAFSNSNKRLIQTAFNLNQD
jgi:hypothetical protein